MQAEVACWKAVNSPSVQALSHLNFYDRKIKVPEAAGLVNAVIKLPVWAYLSKGMEMVNKLQWTYY